jgi:hypothetical protein
MRRGDLVLLGRQLLHQRLEPVAAAPDRQLETSADVAGRDLDRQRLGLQALAVAGLAGALDW